MDIYLPGPAVTTFGTFAAGINNVSDAAAAHLALYHGAVAHTPGALPPRVLSAQEYALLKGLLSRDSQRIPRSPVATRALGVRCLTSTALMGFTAHVTMRLAQQFDAVRLIMLNPCASATVGVKAAISAGGDIANPLNSAGAWTPLTFSGGAATVALPSAADPQVPSLTVSDWIDIQGDATRLLNVRVYIPPTGNTEHPLVTMSMVPASWATYPNREWIQRNQTGDFVATPTGMTAAANAATTTICGVQYMARGKVVCVMGNGDSIMHGVGSIAGPDGYAHRACNLVSASTGIPIEWANFGWPGQTSLQFYARAVAFLPVLRPHILIQPVYTPNDGLPTAASTGLQMSRFARIREMVSAYNGGIVAVTAMPRTSAVAVTASAYTAAQDDFRKTASAAATACDFVADVGGALSDQHVAGVASRYQMTALGFPADFTDDFLHPSDAGHAAAAAVLAPVLARLV